MTKILYTNQLSFPTESVDALVIGAFDHQELTPFASQVDHILNGAIKRGMEASTFKGKISDTLMFLSPHLLVKRILLIGLGSPDRPCRHGIEKAGALISKHLQSTPAKYIHVCIDWIGSKDIQNFEVSPLLAHGLSLYSFHFDHHKTKRDNLPTDFEQVTFYTPSVEESKSCDKELDAICQGNITTRFLVDEAPNIIYPESFANMAKDQLKPLGVTVEIFDQKDLKKMGFNTMLAVAQGSAHEPRLVVLQWHGGKDKKEAPVAFVGKGVTFDSGGINIKPSTGMEDMKGDMAGAGTIFGLFKTLALRQSPVNAVGILGLVENMPSGTAQRPSDVVKSLSGLSVEVLNTDAEGRLVLADALWYTQDRFKPKAMIDLATLTGAIVVALGHEYAGLFSNHDELSKNLLCCGDEVGERLWRMPLHKNYEKDIESDIADVKNVGSGRGAGSITAAEFLKKFVGDVPWAHLDIAGTESDNKGRDLFRKGATGFGVRLLNRFLKKHYEG